MKSTDLYKQYFSANYVNGGDVRRGASVVLNVMSDDGLLEYKVSVSFFLHEDEEDFRISSDRYFEKTLYRGTGRRSGKKDHIYLDAVRETAEQIAEESGAVINWDVPLTEARIDI